MRRGYFFILVSILIGTQVIACGTNEESGRVNATSGSGATVSGAGGEDGGNSGSAGSAAGAGADAGAPPDEKTPEAAELVSSSQLRLMTPEVTSSEAEELKQGNTAFALELYGVLSREAEEDENLFFSPYSISAALAMTYAGARNNTAAQMAETLHFTLQPDRFHEAFNQLDWALQFRVEPSQYAEKGFRLNIVNAIWPQREYAFLPDFLEVLAIHYGASLYLLDFSADPDGSRLIINEWVAEQTEDYIKDLIPQGIVTELTRLVLTNAVYFNAAWRHPFEETDTVEGSFTRVDGSKVNVPMMNQTAEMSYAEGEGFKAVRIPYEQRALGMALILPDDFRAFESDLGASDLSAILDKFESAMVTIRMPKFSFASEFDLNDALKALGMTEAFGTAADFSGMNGNLDLYIQAVLHKAYIDVNETGTEAAAATAVVMGEKGVALVREITIDRPFLFLIWDQPTGAIVFLGRVTDPS